MSTVIFLLELLCYISILYNLFSLEPTKSKIKSSLFVLFLLSGIAYYVYFEITDNLAIPANITVGFLCLFLFKDKIFPLITKMILIALTSSLIPYTFLYTYHIIAQVEFSTSSYIYNASFTITYLSLIIIPILAKNKLGKHFDIFSSFSIKQNILLFIITIIDFFIFTMASLLLNPTDRINRGGRIVLIICIISVVVLSISMLLLYFYLKKLNNVLVENNQINERLLKQEEQHYYEIKKKNDDLRSFRHDYNYHVCALHSLAVKENIDELKNYISELSNIKDDLSYIQTNNVVADSIINYFTENFSEKITFKIDGKFPDKLFIANSDLCVILSNTVKNAVEASIKTSNPVVNISLYANSTYATIIVQNSSINYSDNELTDMKTSKLDRKNHGFGLKNIKKTVSKYNGTFDIEYVDNIFNTRIYLNNSAPTNITTL